MKVLNFLIGKEITHGPWEFWNNDEIQSFSQILSLIFSSFFFFLFSASSFSLHPHSPNNYASWPLPTILPKSQTHIYLIGSPCSGQLLDFMVVTAGVIVLLVSICTPFIGSTNAFILVRDRVLYSSP